MSRPIETTGANVTRREPMSSPSNDERIEEILHYWFGDPRDGAVDLDERNKFWFDSNPEVDETIRRRFEPDLKRAIAGELDGWASTARGTLALIVMFDQFSRNLYRGTPAAFAQDPLALGHAQRLIETGAINELGPVEKAFVYLPFEHSERIEIQQRSVELFRALVGEAPEQHSALFEEFLDFAMQHERIIARFGRYPHRNKALGRTSTPEEVAFLASPGSSF